MFMRMVGGSELLHRRTARGAGRARNRQGRRSDHYAAHLLRHCTHHTSHGSEAGSGDIAGRQYRPEEIRRAITRRTRAIMPVHFAGLPCDMSAIWRLAGTRSLRYRRRRARGWRHYHGHPIGTADGEDSEGASDAVAFSFLRHQEHEHGRGRHGDDAARIAGARMRMLSLHGMNRDAWSRYTAAATGTTKSWTGDSSTI